MNHIAFIKIALAKILMATEETRYFFLLDYVKLHNDQMHVGSEERFYVAHKCLTLCEYGNYHLEFTNFFPFLMIIPL